MHNIIIIGNGFDLAHGLKTSYKNFIIWYLDQAYKKFCTHGCLNKSDTELITIKNNSGKNHFTYRKIKCISDFYEKMTLEKIKWNSNSDYVDRLLKNGKANKWKDIEFGYYQSLIDKFIEIQDKSSSAQAPATGKIKNHNIYFKALRNQLINYLDTIKITDEIKEIEILKRFEDIRSLGTVDVLNFNYTSTPELYSDYYDDIHYIHGKLNDPYYPIIFGYGDEMDTFYPKIERLNENEWICNFKSFGYLHNPTYFNFFNKFSTIYSKEIYNVFIMGHSCGISDRVLLNKILESEQCRKINILYYQKDEKENDYTEKTYELSRHFRPEFKHKMRNKIVPFELSHPLTKFKSLY